MRTEVNYSPEVVNELLARIAGGLSLRKACLTDGMPSPESWRRWMQEHEGLRAQYAQARADRASARADEILDIADDENIPVESRKVRIDARKWEASKLDRAVYGDRQQVEHSGAIGDGLTEAQRAQRIAEILRAAAGRPDGEGK